MQREKIRREQKGDNRFEGEVGAGELHQQRGLDGPSSTVYNLVESKGKITVLIGVGSPEEIRAQQGRQL